MEAPSFLVQVLIYLAAAVLMVPIARKLGLGSVLGYLIGGILIGPAVLNLVGQKTEDVLHFSEFGVVMMLFLIGLELEPSRLWRLRIPILGMGGLQVMITLVVVAGAAYGFGVELKSAIALGMALALSSTAIVLQTLQEKGLLSSAGGQSSFSVLLFQDIAVIPMLAIIPLLGSGDGSMDLGHELQWVAELPGWLHMLVVFGAIGGVILSGRYLVRPLLRMVAKSQVRELFTTSALLIVVGIAAIMEAVGLSPALGTFLAGVVLANSEYRHELESDIEPFKGILLGLFFISIGSTIDFPMILEDPMGIILLVLGLMTIKGLILFGIGKYFKLSLDQNFLFSLGLAQMGEFAFVLFSFAGSVEAIPAPLISKMIAVVALSMALTPVVMLVFERFIQPRVGTLESEDRDDDHIEEHHPVVIVGFGRVGNTIGRFLRAHGIQATVLDNDSDRVDLLRKMGFKVYYGDASRLDLLRLTGLEKAQLIIVALDNEDLNLGIVKMVKKHYPHLHILSRAKDYNDSFNLMDEGLLHIYRETLDTSLRMGVDAMKLLGHRAYSTERSALKFRKHEEKAAKELAAYRHDKGEYITAVRERIEDLEMLIAEDRKDLILEDRAWDQKIERPDEST